MVNARVWRGLVRQRLWKTTAAAGIAVTAIGAGIGMSGSVAGATPTPAGTAAANWLAKPAQMKTGNHFVTATFAPTTPTVGLTVDGLLAFAAAGTTFVGEVTAIAAWLDTGAHIGGYIQPSGNYSSGGLANVALAVEVAAAVLPTKGYTPTTFAGTNLITKLEHTQNATRSFDGVFADPTIQSLAIVVIEHATSGFSGLPSAATFLEGTACTTHGTPHGYPSTYTPTFGACSVNAQGGDVDTTGAVSQALSYYFHQTGNTTARTAAEGANAWLDSTTVKVTAGTTEVAWQDFCTPATFTALTPSVNSTALAIQGLKDDPRGAMRPASFTTDITDGVNWLEAAQDTTPGTTDGSLPACTDSGPGNVRATTQGVQGLTETSWVDLL
jgi:hypothetical protein